MDSTTHAEMKTGHVGLNVTDLNRSRRFYQEALGLAILGESAETGREFAFLGEGERLVLTLWQQSGGQFSSATPGLHHLAFQVPNVEAVRAAQRRLSAMGVTFLYDGVVPHVEGAESGGIFFMDPDGIRLEICTPSGAGDQPAPTGQAPTCGFF